MSGRRGEVRRDGRSPLDFIKRRHGTILTPLRDQTVMVTRRPGARASCLFREPHARFKGWPLAPNPSSARDCRNRPSLQDDANTMRTTFSHIDIGAERIVLN